MASFGKLTNSLMQVSQENTLAFANLNFDFSLIKYEAPDQYRGLGECLSPHRKGAAEDGTTHITARKLAGLFEGLMPNVPKLIEAYGLRSSEIAKLPEINPQGSTAAGVFADHVGADGSTIWAAATSGGSAVTMHLLACLLARMWKREQAVSLWVDLVEKRRLQLQKLVSEHGQTFKVADLAAARIEISRRQLDEWDSGARAWLQTADEAKAVQQTQSRLIFDNQSLPVSTQTSAYEAIIEAWTSALTGLESLIQGIPQRINNAAVLLGLSAWHLYPDIMIAGTNQLIKQGDPLIASGGIITLGLTNREGDGDGVFWSLPLTHAKYYEDVSITTRHSGVGQSRVAFEEFLYVVVGSIISRWDSKDTTLEDALWLLETLGRSVQHWNPSEETSIKFGVEKPDLEWARMVGSALKRYSTSKGLARQQITRLISFGQRRCSGFLTHPTAQSYSVFGLTNVELLLRALSSSDHGQAMLSFLRSWGCRELATDVAQHAIIRWCSTPLERFRFTRLAAAEPQSKRRKKDPDSGQGSAGSNAPLAWMDESWDQDIAKSLTRETGDDSLEIMMPHGPGEELTPHYLVCGAPNYAAIYLPRHIGQSAITRNTLKASQLIKCIKEGDIGGDQIAYALVVISSFYEKSQVVDSLCAVEAGQRVYSRLPGAKVDLQVTSRRISTSKWWTELKQPFSQCRLQAIFSCIAYFETGEYDIDPQIIGDQAFGISLSSSIFVASRLLGDPYQRSRASGVQRIVGNIGKPGLAVLTTPSNPKIRKVDYSSWHAIAHEPFDGTAQNHFRGTSCHLSFTGYELPLNVGSKGGRDVLAYFLETAISVYEQGKWVADVDVLDAARRWRLQKVGPCNHDNKQREDLDFSSLVSVDSWSELLDLPVQTAIVRASKDHIARLATASVASRLASKVIVLPSEVKCLSCHFHDFTAEGRASLTAEAPGQGSVSPTRTASEECSIGDVEESPYDSDMEDIEYDSQEEEIKPKSLITVYIY